MFPGKEAPNLVDLDQATFCHWHHKKYKLVKICTWEQIQSKGSNRKMANEKLKFNYKTQKQNLDQSIN
jgi:hypothetical protein